MKGGSGVGIRGRGFCCPVRAPALTAPFFVEAEPLRDENFTAAEGVFHSRLSAEQVEKHLAARKNARLDCSRKDFCLYGFSFAEAEPLRDWRLLFYLGQIILYFFNI